MKLITPTIEIFKQTDELTHLCKCARICYASEKNTDNEKLRDNLLKNGHISMFRHISKYYIIDKTYPKFNKVFGHITTYNESPYLNYVYDGNSLYVSTNGQFIEEHPFLAIILKPYEVDWNVFNCYCPYNDIKRYTICVTTQISTTRELNRVSPNNISEQSTRYVNFGKKGGIGICIPHFYDKLSPYRQFICRFAWKIYEHFYNKALKWGLPAQDAREFLPLTSYSKAVYTYTLKEWKHILDLRYIGTTGKPHPNAFAIAKEIHYYFVSNGIIDE